MPNAGFESSPPPLDLGTPLLDGDMPPLDFGPPPLDLGPPLLLLRSTFYVMPGLKVVFMTGLEWCRVIKYLGCYFRVNSCYVDIRQQIRKYYGNLNNIFSVLGKGRNETAAVYLILKKLLSLCQMC